MITKVLSKIGLPVLLKYVASSLSGINSDVARRAGLALNDVDSAIREKQISDGELSEADRHAETMQKVEAEYDLKTLSLINDTIRRELDSESRFISFWRPAFGYSVAVAWLLNMSAICYIVVFDAENAADIINALAETTSLWSIALGVLGISVVKSSQERQIGKGIMPSKRTNK